MKPGRVCIVDDDASVRKALGRFLRAVGYETDTFESAAAYLEGPVSTTPSCLVLDVRMPGMNGVELHQKIAGTPRALPVIFITGEGAAEARSEAMQADVIAVLDKPLDETSLLEAITRALEISRAR